MRLPLLLALLLVAPGAACASAVVTIPLATAIAMLILS